MKPPYLILLLPLLSACSLGVYGDDFECDPSKGMGCKSVSEVNEAVSENRKSCSCTNHRIYFPSRQNAKGNIYEASYVTLGGTPE